MKICKQALAAILACALLCLPVLPAKAATSAEDVLNALWAACAAGDYDTALYYVDNERNQMLFESLMDENDEYRSIDPQTGKMLGIFCVQRYEVGLDDGSPFAYGTYLVYYGDQQDGLRSGNGVLMYQILNEPGTANWDKWYYFAKGEWANDKPNGYWYEEEVECNFVGHYTDYAEDNILTDTAEGQVVNGLWNGTVVMNHSWSYDSYEGITRTPVVYKFKNGYAVSSDSKLSVSGERQYKVTDYVVDSIDFGWWGEEQYTSTWGVKGFAEESFVFSS